MSRRFREASIAFAAVLLCSSIALCAEPKPAQKDIDLWVREGVGYYSGPEEAEQGNYARARVLFERAAKHDHPEALYYLAVMYFEGHGVERDAARANALFLKAAELGSANAQMVTGVRLIFESKIKEFGSGEQKKKYEEAASWLEKSAVQGNPEAQFWYGDMLMKGLGTKEDKPKGIKFIRESAEAGNPNGQAMLGACYWQGDGLEKDLVRAYKWVYLSDKGGNENAKALMGYIAEEMKPKAVTQAKTDAELWLKRQEALSHDKR